MPPRPLLPIKSRMHPDGYELLGCPGCNAWPVRSTPGMETWVDKNWMRTCPRCKRRLCFESCCPAGTAQCVLCDAEDATERMLTALATPAAPE